GPVGLGLEINVDYLAACAVDLAGNIRDNRTLHGDQRGRRSADILGDLAELARKVSDHPEFTVAGAAVAVPGLVETPRGRIRSAPNLRWQDVEIAQELRELLPDTPFAPAVGNEADFAALAQAHDARRGAIGAGRGGAAGDTAGAGVTAGVAGATGSAGAPALAIDGANGRSARPGASPAGHTNATGTGTGTGTDDPAASHPDAPLTDFLYVSGEIGVGAGIVLDGELFRGARGWAGEIGHVTVEPGGTQCRCGALGCLETVAGLEALRRTGPEAAADALGRAVATAVNLLDLPAVVLGGVYARPEFAAALLPGVEQAVARHVVSARWAPVAVRVSQLGETAAATGAAFAVIRRIHADPAGWLEVLTRS
ncbi:MAG: ROK family protein, partial [Catenulispora sp.]|nr:ROK family protein [Catenulispora sp.]